jgi:hypothetical protein
MQSTIKNKKSRFLAGLYCDLGMSEGMYFVYLWCYWGLLSLFSLTIVSEGELVKSLNDSVQRSSPYSVGMAEVWVWLAIAELKPRSGANSIWVAKVRIKLRHFWLSVVQPNAKIRSGEQPQQS